MIINFTLDTGDQAISECNGEKTVWRYGRPLFHHQSRSYWVISRSSCSYRTHLISSPLFISPTHVQATEHLEAAFARDAVSQEEVRGKEWIHKYMQTHINRVAPSFSFPSYPVYGSMWQAHLPIQDNWSSSHSSRHHYWYQVRIPMLDTSCTCFSLTSISLLHLSLDPSWRNTTWIALGRWSDCYD